MQVVGTIALHLIRPTRPSQPLTKVLFPKWTANETIMRHSDDACCGAGISAPTVRRGVEARLCDRLPKSAGSRDSRVCRAG